MKALVAAQCEKCDKQIEVAPSAQVRFWAKVVKRGPDECWLWIGAIKSNGYGHLSRGRRGEGTVMAHRLSYKLHHGHIPEGMEICHRCDVRNCVNPRHLFVGTSADNHADMVAKGRELRGERNPQAKLTEAEVLAIRGSEQHSDELAQFYGVSREHVDRLRRGTSWAHLAGAQ